MKELIIIGAGPAGLSAAVTAASYGVQVMIIDEFFKPGGRLLGQLHEEPDGTWWNGQETAAKLYKQAEDLPIEFCLQTSVYHIEHLEDTWIIQSDKGTYESRILLVATGAAERNIPVPGWTLPGVMSIGAAQVMTNVHHVKPGHKGVIVGANVLSMAIARELSLAGVHVEAVTLPAMNLLSKNGAVPVNVFQQLLGLSHLAPTPFFKIGGRLASKFPIIKKTAVHHYPKKGFKVWGIPVQIRRAVTEIIGSEKVEGVKIADITPSGTIIEGTERAIRADFVCIAGGLKPLAELAGVAGCPFRLVPALGGYVPVHDEQMKTPVTNLFVAGNITGIESAQVAMEQGKTAGYSIALQLSLLTDPAIVDRSVIGVKTARNNALIQFHPEIEAGRQHLYSTGD